MDRQDLRIHSSAERGWCEMLDINSILGDPIGVEVAIEKVLVNHGAIRERLLERPLPQGNVLAAGAILKSVLVSHRWGIECEAIDHEVKALLTQREERRLALFA
jgi:hypothetical protein